ncbi:T9SS type A sorting domain-containing protein [Flavobacterium alkalisoli]|uniref:T9SS type A sorting domain-containing protein n=1 Tax=Flavobacterium alkalisoli TaxID=2602769 RepID=A0A5B9G028_9FLAO|nr:T9SS type A sorting domain-containing protein [Flavobacterium alkalisoli]QEE50632.1 T9SS type A sorting domain-containing protein [Flavobacterium alkalisoli]
MKIFGIKLLYLLLLLLSGGLYSQTIDFTDPNFKYFLTLIDESECSIYSDYGYAKNSLGECITIDANNDNEIDMIEAAAVWELSFPHVFMGWSGMDSFDGLEAFVNIRVITIEFDFSFIDLSVLPNLEEVYLRTDELVSLDCSTLTNLEHLKCDCENLASLTINNLQNLKVLDIENSYNSPIPLNLSGLISLEEINCSYTSLSQLDCTNLTNLKKIDSGFCTGLTSVNTSGLQNLEEVYLPGCTSLTVFNCEDNNNIKHIDLSGCSALTSPYDFTYIETLETLNISNSNIVSVNISNITGLKELYFDNTIFTQINLDGLSSLEKLSCKQSLLQSLDVSEAVSLIDLNCYRAESLNTLTLGNLSNLISLDCTLCPITTLDVSGLLSLESLIMYGTFVESLDLTALENIEIFNAVNSPNISSIALGTHPELHTFEVESCGLLQEIDCSGLENVTVLNFSNCVSLTTIILNDLPNLTELTCGGAEGTPLLTSLQIGQMPLLLKVWFRHCESLEYLDLSGCPSLNRLHLQYCTGLSYINLKNGSVGYVYFNMYNNMNHPYICIDEDEEFYIFEDISPNDAYVSTYCPDGGGNYNTISGILTFDNGDNNCEEFTYLSDFIKIGVTESTNSGATFTNPSGEYKFYVGAGSYNILPEFENDWFTATPTSATINFSSENGLSQIQDFCITANGSHPDAEINIISLEPAQPGMDASYKITYSNKGNTILSGSVSINYENDVMDLVSANPLQDNNNNGTIEWNFTDLLPFEKRSINVVFNVNGPMENPAVNINDVLTYTVSVDLDPDTDETPQDNEFIYNEVVVGSFDPNEIICMEGEIVSVENIGDYLHYNINFENIGNAQAVNVNVIELIDLSLFDITTLELIDASHEVVIRIEGNMVEYKFENINLGPQERGNVAYKIKTLNTLEAGDSVVQKANIFFDYNWPIMTNEAVTMFDVLAGIDDFEMDSFIKVYPNPAEDFVNIASVDNISSIEVYDSNGRLLQIALVNDTNTVLELSTKIQGIYYLKIITDRGTKFEKIIKK